jgi:polyisoprenoid-binding protein YceI
MSRARDSRWSAFHARTLASSALILLWSSGAAAATNTFAVDASASSVLVHVGKTGIGSFAGHEHDVVAQSLRGEVVADFDDLARSSVDISVNARSLKVTGRDEPEEDVPKVQQAMTGPKVLDAARFPGIRFRSREVASRRLSPGLYDLLVTGDLSLHGATKTMTIPIRLEVRGDTLTGIGTMVVKQTDFGIEPVVAAGGLVKVEDEVTVSFRIVARAGTP